MNFTPTDSGEEPNLKRQKKFEFKLTPSSTEPATDNIELECDIRYGDSVVPNILVGSVAALGGPLYIFLGSVGLLTDYLTENLYHCKEEVLVKSKELTPKEGKENPTFKVAVFFNQPLSDTKKKKLFELWKENLEKSVSVDIIPSQTVNDILRYYNKMDSDVSSINRLQKNARLEIVNKTHATHFLFVQINHHSNETVHLKWELIDAYSLKKDAIYSNEKTIEDIKLVEISKASTEDYFYYYLFPNSITYSLLASNFSTLILGDSGYTVVSEKVNSTIPSVLAKLGFKTIEHSNAFSAWQFRFGLFPEYGIAYQDVTYKLDVSDSYKSKTDPSKNSLDYRLKTSTFTVFLNTGPQLHTPIGRLGIYLSGGPEYSYYSDSLGTRYSNAVFLYGAGLDYLGFLTKDFFFSFNFKFLKKDKKTIESQFIYDTQLFISSNIDIGYFL